MPQKLSVNTSIDQQSEERIKALLEQQANIQAEIDSIKISTRATSVRNARSPIYKHRSDFNVPRSHSLSVSPMSRQLSDRGLYHSSMQRTTSGPTPQHSAPGMSRTRSNLSGGTPFTNNGSVPIPRFSKVHRDTSVIDNWTTSGEDPISEYTFAQLPARNSGKTGLEDVGEDVDNYLSRTSGLPELDLPASSTHAANDRVSGQSHLGLPVSPQQLGLPSPVSLYSETMTNGSTLPSEMSRQSSSNEALIGRFEMINVNSNSSSYSDVEDNLYFSDLARPCSGDEQTQLLFGAGGVSQAAICPSFSDEAGCMFPSTTLHLESMQRSPSNDSNSSNESNSSTSSSRSKTQLQRQIQLANARPLAAKPVTGDTAMSREPSSQSMMRVPSDKGGEERLVQAIPKALYQRPLHPKVWCKKCNDYPEGFRGEHELRRHTDRQHKVVVKKWICSKPHDGLSGPDHPEPINPLSRCKVCSQVKKRYGAYYNAAAHLRRSHFNPKPKGRGKGAKNDGKPAEKRGGKGGGDWPSMAELKRWMQEVDELVLENEQQPEPEDESDGDYMNIDYSEGSMQFSNPSTDSLIMNANFLPNSNNNNSNNVLLDTYTAPMISHDNLQATQNMHIDMQHMHTSASNIDLVDMSHANIDASAMFFDVQNVLLMDDMNDSISFSSCSSSSFPSADQRQALQQQQQQQTQQHILQQQQQLGHSDEFDSLHQYSYNNSM